MMKVLLIFRALFLSVFIPIHTLVCSVLVIVSLLLGFSRFSTGRIVRFWGRVILFFCGIKVQVRGEENRPGDGGFIYLFTHSSYLDIPVLVSSSPKFFSFGAKHSLFKIPFFGQAMTLLGVLPITRRDRGKAIQVYRRAEKRLLNGDVFALSPEGGRRGGDEIGDFKSGPFIFAVNAKAPLVPVVLCGVDRCLKRGSIFINGDSLVRRVGVHILPSVDVSDLTVDDARTLKERVRRQILEEFESMKKVYLQDS